MAKYVLKRLLMMVLVVLGISFIVFTIMNLTPGNAAQMILGQSARPEQVAELEAQLGLNRPFLVRYFSYIFSALRGDFGQSYKRRGCDFRSPFRCSFPGYSIMPTNMTMLSGTSLMVIVAVFLFPNVAFENVAFEMETVAISIFASPPISVAP